MEKNVQSAVITMATYFWQPIFLFISPTVMGMFDLNFKEQFYLKRIWCL